MSKVFVVADDITGADDIGLMYYKSGHESVVFPYSSWREASFDFSDKVVIDTDSRLVSRQEAYKRVFNVVKKYSNDDISLYFDKQCSVFRGNIGAEFDAMLDALNADFAPVVLGFPDNGRTTVDGVHYVHGTRLEESQFRYDPMNPMTKSNLVDILSEQTSRRVSLISYHEYSGGLSHLKAVFEKEKAKGGYVIFDVRDNEDLKSLSLLLKNERIICGSSAIAYYLGLLEPAAKVEDDAVTEKDSSGHVLCIAGSQTPQTKGQVSFSVSAGAYEIELDTVALFEPGKEHEVMEYILSEYAKQYENFNMVIIHVPFNHETVLKSKKAALESGISEQVSAKKVSSTLASIARLIHQDYPLDGVIVCGGDTSASFIKEFGIKGMLVSKEIESGVSVCRDIYNKSFSFVLKSGSFGGMEFLEKSRKMLEEANE